MLSIVLYNACFEGKKSVTAFNLLVILCFAFFSGTSTLFESNCTKSKPFGCKTSPFTKSRNMPKICFSFSQCPQKFFVSLYLGLSHVKGATFNGGFKTNVQQHIKRLKEGVFQGPSLVELTEKGKNRRRKGVELRSTLQEIGTYLWEAFGLYLPVSVNGQRKLQCRACTNYRTTCDLVANKILLPRTKKCLTNLFFITSFFPMPFFFIAE